MLERAYDPTRPYRFAQYGRMSNPKQNKRSPDQQFNTISETLQRCSYPWQGVCTYRDDGISGRYLRKRTGFQKMLRDIQAGLIQIDLIVVDTLERLGRAEEIAELRRKLFVEYGILIVAADNNFCDPTGVIGKAVGMVEQIRSTENTRIARHNILRGKKDAARRGHWPGGPPPFGFQLKTVVNESVAPPEVYSILEVEPREAAARQLAFERAAATGEGVLRMSQWWNANPEIPDDFKPISPFTMGYRLSNHIYIGELVWGAHRTGVVNDTRVIEPNPDGPEVIPNFCPSLVSVELFQRLQQVRRLRSEQILQSRQPDGEEASPPKLIAPQARGLTLKHLLTGLVRCGRCQASMRPLPSGRKSKAGKRYVYYVCPRHYDGACPNRHHVPENQLREAVLSRVRAQLFPAPQGPDSTPAWLPELLQLVQHELERCRQEQPDHAAAVGQELHELERQLAGWSITLADPQLPTVVRADIVAKYEQAKKRQHVLEQAVITRRALQEHVQQMLDPRQVFVQLQNLADVLASYNPTLGNLELSKHIDRIVCHPNGTIELRGTLLGLFEGAVELLSRPTAGQGNAEETPTEPSGCRPVTPRRRGRLRIPDLVTDQAAPVGEVDSTLDPDRFVGLPEPFFWVETFVLPRKHCWAEEHAVEVARLRANGLTMGALARHFKRTVPTIRHALRLAAAAEESFRKLPSKMPPPCWAKDHAGEVAELKGAGWSTLQIARHFGKSDTTIRAALHHAAQDATREPQASPPAVEPSSTETDCPDDGQVA